MESSLGFRRLSQKKERKNFSESQGHRMLFDLGLWATLSLPYTTLPPWSGLDVWETILVVLWENQLYCNFTSSNIQTQGLVFSEALLSKEVQISSSSFWQISGPD